MAKSQIKLTESELDILVVLWSKEEASVREVHNELAKTKTSGYTTTLKLMQIMYDKGLVKRDERSKAHLYKPAVSRAKMQKQYLSKTIKGLFDGDSGTLALQALALKKPSKEKAEEIRKYLISLKK